MCEGDLKAMIINRRSRFKGVLQAILAGVIAIAVACPLLPAAAQRRSGGGGGSFSRSGSGFGGGSFNRSGSSFSGGSVGRGNVGSSSSGSFNRGGAFGSRSYTGSSSGSSYFYGGRSAHYYGGYGDYWYHPAWYYWTPFHPAFYFGAPYIGSDGYYHPGGFSIIRLFMSLVFFVFVLWLIVKIFFGSKSVRYTTYN